MKILHRTSAKYDVSKWWIRAGESIVFGKPGWMWTGKKKRLWIYAVQGQVECDIYYLVWDELKVLSPLGICTEIDKDVQLCPWSSLNHLYLDREKCSSLFEAVANWLVISVYYLAINTQRQWDRWMRHQQKAFIGQYPWGVWRCQKVTTENVWQLVSIYMQCHWCTYPF